MNKTSRGQRPSIRFQRCLSPEFESCLVAGQPLRFLLKGPTIHGRDGLQLEPQLREQDSLMLYAGMSCVLVLEYRERTREFVLRAHTAYNLAGHGVAKRYPIADAARLATDLKGYFEAVRVGSRWLLKEGNCQAWLTRRFGVERTAPEDWAALDSQSVIGFADGHAKEKFWAPILENGRRTLAALNIRSRGLGGELDLLIWDPQAREFLLTEIKDGGSCDLYLGPLQVACYLAAWQAFSRVDPQCALSGLRNLLAQKQRLGLVRQACRLPETASDLCFRPVIVVQSPKTRSSCWTKFETVRRTLEETWHGTEASSTAPEFLARLAVYQLADEKLTNITQQYSQWCR